jgi:hypothetical protein
LDLIVGKRNGAKELCAKLIQESQEEEHRGAKGITGQQMDFPYLPYPNG